MRCPIKRRILTLLGAHHIRMTPVDLERTVRQQLPGVRRIAVRNAVKALTAEGSLHYTNHFSTTHLEQNHNSPTQVSDRILLCSANCTPPKRDKSTSIRLQDGAAFGVGDHPTTRLCIQGMDYALAKKKYGNRLDNMTALDVGTGSAVLALAAIGLGLGRAVGIDIDPIACNEARINVAFNGMTDRITISNALLVEDERVTYDVILANLRPPTLRQIFPTLITFSKSKTIWVLSGFRQDEEKGIMAIWPSNTMNVIWRSQERGWAGMVLVQSGPDRGT